MRYKRAAKALMRLSPDYLRTYNPEEIDNMAWESLETAITLWIQHLELAVKKVLAAEKQLCTQVLSGLLDGQIWFECFVKTADKIMAVFFRFGEGVARSSSEPQKLFKFLDMYDQLEKMKPLFVEVFEGEAGSDICSRFRELEKLLIHASSKVFWDMGLQIEGNQDGIPPPKDGSVPKLVRYAVNYLKYLATDPYRDVMATVLKTEQTWKMGVDLSRPESEDQFLLRDAITNVMEAMQRNVEIKKSRYKDKVLAHVFSMNTNWYVYMRSRNSELGKVVGESWLKTHFKTMAEESAYSYQKSVWGPVARHMEVDPTSRTGSSPILNRPPSLSNPKTAMNSRSVVGYDAKLEAFMRGVEENMQKHRSGNYRIPDMDLKVQIKAAAMMLVVPAYASFVESCSRTMLHITNAWPTLEMVKEMVRQTYDDVGSSIQSDGRASRRRQRADGRVSNANTSIDDPHMTFDD